VPIGAAEANREVQVTIEPTQTRSAVNKDYPAWLWSLAGQWRGEFERPLQGTLEERELLP
jgi:hypothetical protein